MDLKAFEREGLAQVQSLFQDSEFRLLISADYGSALNSNADSGQEHRSNIRLSISQNCWPSPESGHVSISHTKGAGAVLFHPQYQVGVDLEISARVQDKIVSRVSSPQELALEISPSQLWVAKEASFKASRNNHQPAALSGIQIDSFDKQSNLFSFSLNKSSSKSTGYGLVISYFEFTLAMAFLKPSHRENS